jgi:hypothetical protein
MKVLANNQKNPGMSLKMGKSSIGNQPPKNNVAHMVVIKIMLAYSAKKNIAKAIPEYSIM